MTMTMLKNIIRRDSNLEPTETNVKKDLFTIQYSKSIYYNLN